jgi:hypothetical protein
MYLQANKPLFSSSFVHDRDYGGTPPEELSAPAAEHEAPLGDQQSEGKKKSLTEFFVHLYQPFFHLFPNLFNFLLWYEEVQNAVELLRVGQVATVA